VTSQIRCGKLGGRTISLRFLTGEDDLGPWLSHFFVSRVGIWMYTIRHTLPLPDDHDCFCRDPETILSELKKRKQMPYWALVADHKAAS
jgi:hypothetical protein